VTAIKEEVEKLLKFGFIYLVPLTEWVSNLVPFDKNKGTIHVFMEFSDLNNDRPKDSYPTPSIDQIIECSRSEIFSFMDGFSSYNQIQIRPKDYHKNAFIFPWDMFTYQKISVGLKIVGATFQWAMSYAFHDVNHIIEVYLVDLVAHSRKRKNHLSHLHVIFDICQ
jgi:hypothetical protein